MAKIYEFPTEKELPQELKDHLRLIAQNYIYVLEEAAKYFYGKNLTDDQFDEVGLLVTGAYADVVLNVIKELEES